MYSHMPNRRLGRLPLFRSRSPLGLSSRRRLMQESIISVRQTPGRTALVLVVSAAIFAGLFLVLFQTLLIPQSLFLQDVATKSRVRRWTPPVPRPDPRPHSLSSLPFLPDPDLLDFSNENFQRFFASDDDHDAAITAILPVTAQSLNKLHLNLDSLLLSARASLLKEIIILCHPNLVSRTEQYMSKMARASLHTSIMMTVLPSSQPYSLSLSVLHVLPSVFTSRVLLLEISALSDIDDITQMMLLDTAPSAVPVGPHGVVISSTNASCVYPAERPIPAAYLVPPFLSPTSLLAQAENGMRLDTDTWAALGERIVRIGGTGLGGLVINSRSNSQRWCTDAISSISRDSGSSFLRSFHRLLEQDSADNRLESLRVDILLPTRQDLEAFGPTACEMAQRGSILRVMLFSWSHSEASVHFALDVGCHIHFETIPRISPMSTLIKRLKGWVQGGDGITVLIYASQMSAQTLVIESSVEALRLAGGTIVHIPVDDLPFCEWMSMLGISEWKNWQKPRIDLSVITNDRPRSLARLLTSLAAARYYGDPVQLKINLEQTADTETRQKVARFRWESGALHVQHRIIAAGLLPAVIEAWYPHDNDSYGVLLEDDIELSPMFYAWIKMTILRYRYGLPHSRGHSLFGVSLYQPTNLELRVEGRVPFEPRIIFAEHELPDSRTPYLSQVPCSWGAVYFPEHFVEFHDYLALRLSEVSHNISEVIVPDIRSNRWTRSWKKYFNELVYLRGYVMLYPNYDLSLATNHVEVGAHVKSDTSHIRDSIKRQFEVPLMPLPLFPTASGARMANLLDLPAGTLPSWDNLPVLDLWGIVTSHKEIVDRGQERHEIISGCTSLRYSAQFQYDASQLLCTQLLVR